MRVKVISRTFLFSLYLCLQILRVASSPVLPSGLLQTFSTDYGSTPPEGSDEEKSGYGVVKVEPVNNAVVNRNLHHVDKTFSSLDDVFALSAFGLDQGVNAKIPVQNNAYAYDVTYNVTPEGTYVQEAQMVESTSSEWTFSCNTAFKDSVITALNSLAQDGTAWFHVDLWYGTFSRETTYLPLAIIGDGYKKTWIVCDLEIAPPLLLQLESRFPRPLFAHTTRIESVGSLQSPYVILRKGEGFLLSQNATVQHAWVYYYHSPQYRDDMYKSTKVDVIPEIPIICVGDDFEYMPMYKALNDGMDEFTVKKKVFDHKTIATAIYMKKAEIKIGSNDITVFCYDYLLNQNLKDY